MKKVQPKLTRQRKKHKALVGLDTHKHTFQSHLLEIRLRLLWLLVTLGIGTGIGYYFYPQILAILLKPSQGPIFYTSPAGGFDFTLKISLFFGFLFSFPMIIYHIIRFLQPALPHKSFLFIGKFFFLSIFLLILGMCFAYFVSLPAALHFLSQFSSNQVQSLISTDAYFSFVTRYILGFGILFELPLFLLLINSFMPLTMKTLFSYQKFVIVLSFVLAAIITPTPDIFNQLIMAIPLILLYEISILIIYVINKNTFVEKNRIDTRQYFS